MTTGNVYTPRRLVSDRFHDALVARLDIELRDAKAACATESERENLDKPYFVLRQQWLLLKSIHARRFILDGDLKAPAWQQFSGMAAQVIGLVGTWSSIQPKMSSFMVHAAPVEFAGRIVASYAQLMMDLICVNISLFERHRRTAPLLPPTDPVQAECGDHFTEVGYRAICAGWDALPEYRFEDSQTGAVSDSRPQASDKLPNRIWTIEEYHQAKEWYEKRGLVFNPALQMGSPAAMHVIAQLQYRSFNRDRAQAAAETWPPDSGWHFRPGEAAFLGKAFNITGKPWEVLKTLAESSGPVEWGNLADIVSPNTTPEQATIKGYVSKVRKALRSAFGLDQDNDPIPNTEWGQRTSWKLDSEALRTATEKQR